MILVFHLYREVNIKLRCFVLSYKASVMDDQSVRARELDDENNTNRSDKTLELEEVKEISFLELEDKPEEKSRTFSAELDVNGI